jgi:NADPH-dependent curcumin reductase CurA
MKMMNRQVLLRERPVGLVGPTTTALEEREIPELAEGEFLVKVRMLSIDPTIRTWMGPVPTYLPPIELGAVIRSVGAGEVVASRSARYEVGDLVVGLTGWQEYCVADDGARAMAPLPDGIDLPVALNVLGITGMTAHVGLLEVGAMGEGDVVLVSGAAGATGSMVCQIARRRGAAKVVGIAGGPEKCARLLERFGCDEAIDYRAGHVARELHAACPDGIDVFFDNVGGEILDAGLANLALGARVVICGAIAGYNDPEGPRGPANYLQLLVKRSSMRGFLITDHVASWPAAQAEIAGWLVEGTLEHDEEIVDGLEAAPEALNLLFSGANTGKVLVRLA